MRKPSLGKAMRVAGLAGLGLFVLLAILVHLRLLVGLDLAATTGKQSLAGPLLDVWTDVASILGAAEVTSLLAVAMVVALWRSGAGRWSLAPLAYVPPTLLELVLKLTLTQPPVPREFVRAGHYPFFSLQLSGAFPSGHMLRVAFFCAFFVVLLWRRGGVIPRLASLGLVVLALLMGFARVYGGQHWLADVIGGLLLGTSCALLVAPSVAERLPPPPLRLKHPPS